MPSSMPSSGPTGQPTGQPTSGPTVLPLYDPPTSQPTSRPTSIKENPIFGGGVGSGNKSSNFSDLSTQSAIIIFSCIGAIVLCCFILFSCYFQDKYHNKKEEEKLHSLVEHHYNEDEVALDDGEGMPPSFKYAYVSSFSFFFFCFQGILPNTSCSFSFYSHVHFLIHLCALSHTLMYTFSYIHVHFLIHSCTLSRTFMYTFSYTHVHFSLMYRRWSGRH